MYVCMCGLSLSLSLTAEMIRKLLLFTSSMLNFVGCPFFHGANHRLTEFWKIYSKIKGLVHKGSSVQYPAEDSKSCKQQIPPVESLTVCDIEMVVEKLGMGRFCEEKEMVSDGQAGECGLLEVASLLLQEKEASLEELKEAFAVFDKNRDGFISVMELQEVMCKLEFAEGIKLEDCEKMIRAVDRNGDGRIDFCEFKDMLEHVN